MKDNIEPDYYDQIRRSNLDILRSSADQYRQLVNNREFELSKFFTQVAVLVIPLLFFPLSGTAFNEGLSVKDKRTLVFALISLLLSLLAYASFQLNDLKFFRKWLKSEEDRAEIFRPSIAHFSVEDANKELHWMQEEDDFIKSPSSRFSSRYLYLQGVLMLIGVSLITVVLIDHILK